MTKREKRSRSRPRIKRLQAMGASSNEGEKRRRRAAIETGRGYLGSTPKRATRHRKPARNEGGSNRDRRRKPARTEGIQRRHPGFIRGPRGPGSWERPQAGRNKGDTLGMYREGMRTTGNGRERTGQGSALIGNVCTQAGTGMAISRLGLN